MQLIEEFIVLKMKYKAMEMRNYFRQAFAKLKLN